MIKRLIRKNLNPSHDPFASDAIKSLVIKPLRVKKYDPYETLTKEEKEHAIRLGLKNAKEFREYQQEIDRRNSATISKTTSQQLRSSINLLKAREVARRNGGSEERAARTQAVQDHAVVIGDREPLYNVNRLYSTEDLAKRNQGVGLLTMGLLGAADPVGMATGMIASKGVDEIVRQNSDYKDWADMVTNQNEFTRGIGHTTEGIPLVGNVWGLTNPGWISRGTVSRAKNVTSNALNKVPTIKFYRNLPDFAKKAYLKDMKNTITDYFSTLNSIQPLQLDFTDVKNSKWYSAIKNTYGEDFANNVVEKMNTPEFKLYFIGNDPIKAASEIGKFNQGMDIYSKLAGNPDYGMGVVLGSAALSANGTVHRTSAAPHDLDFKANIKDASKLLIDINNREKVGETLRVLFRNEDKAVTDAPIFNLFRRLFGNRPYINIPTGVPRWAIPKSRNNAFYLTRMFGISEPYGVHRLVLTDVNGYPLDFFMTDQPIKMSLNKYGLGTEGEPLYWKLKWSERSVPRPKDVHDLKEYVPFSDANPIIDIANNDHNYSPFMFGNRILSKEGFPIIKNIETYPGSGIKVPVTMNWKGEWKLLGDPKIDKNLLLESWNQGGKLKYVKSLKIDKNKPRD